MAGWGEAGRGVGCDVGCGDVCDDVCGDVCGDLCGDVCGDVCGGGVCGVGREMCAMCIKVGWGVME